MSVFLTSCGGRQGGELLSKAVVASSSGTQSSVTTTAEKLAFSIAPTSYESGACSTVNTVQLQDAANTAVNASASAVTVNLSGNSNGTFYSDSNCLSSITTLTIAIGASSADFYFHNPTAETVALSAADNAGVLDTGTVNVTTTSANAWVGAYSAPTYLTTTDYNNVQGSGDHAFNTPTGVYLDSNNQLFVADSGNHRIQRWNMTTGTYVGWIGIVRNIPTGGDSGCTTATPGSFTPGWCTGGVATSGAANTKGMNNPTQVYSSGTDLFVTDRDNHRVLKFDIADPSGASKCKWIGRNGAAATVGWTDCGTGTSSTSGAGDGSMSQPSGIFVLGTNMYIADANNNRINLYNTTTGAFVGWIGRFNAVGGCTGVSAYGPNYGASGSYTGAWCNSATSTAQVGDATADGRLTLSGGYASIYANATNFYVTDRSQHRVNVYSVADGSYVSSFAIMGGGTFPASFVGDGSYFYASADYSTSIRRLTLAGVFQDWIGKIGGVGGACTAGVGLFTGLWCNGGSIASGTTSGSFNTSNGGGGPKQMSIGGTSLVVADSGNNRIQSFNVTTGALNGVIGVRSIPHINWRQYGDPVRGIGGGSACCGSDISGNDSIADNGATLNSPTSVATVGTSLLVSDAQKINQYTTSTGILTGWSGYVARTPTGGDPGCTATASGSFTPGWCLGGSTRSQGPVTTHNATGQLWYDGTTHFYTAETGGHRVGKYLASTGAFVGWIGRFNSIAGAACSAPAPAPVSGNFTGGWCTGGTSQAGTAIDGSMSSPYGIVGDGTYLYVSSVGNHRIDRYNLDGSYAGWIGYNSAGAGCTGNTAYNGGWCMAGTSASNNTGAGAMNTPRGLAIDTTNGHLYVAITGTNRVGKYNYGAGTFAGWIGRFNAVGGCVGGGFGAAGSYTNLWCNSATSSTQSGTGSGHLNGPRAVYIDTTHLYVTDSGNHRINKYLLDGTIVGWKGSVGSVAGIGGACTAATPLDSITPDWCTSGTSQSSSSNGGYNTPTGITGDATYLYILDSLNYRLMRTLK